MVPSSLASRRRWYRNWRPSARCRPCSHGVAVAAWRLARADHIEAELFEERQVAQGGLGLALIRDGNGARSFETLLRYRGAAMAEFWRALRTLKALQAEQAAMELQAAEPTTVLGEVTQILYAFRARSRAT